MIGDHSETIQIDYDPTRVTYGELLQVFWESHEPYSRSWSRQYRSAIFYHTDQQRQQVLESKKEWESKTGKSLYTDIEPFKSFYWAEGYHQKYTLRRYGAFFKELDAIYPNLKAFVNSTAAARLNGYLDGHGTAGQLRGELERLGLSESAEKQLLKRVTK